MKTTYKILGMIALFGMLVGPFMGAAQTPEQTQAIADATIFADGAPHGEWQTVIEPVTMFLDGDAPETGTVFGAANPTLDLTQPADEQGGIRIRDAVAFNADDADRPAKDVLLMQVAVSIPGDCTTAAIGLTPALRVTLSGVDFGVADGDQPRSAEIVADEGFQHIFDFSSIGGVTLEAVDDLQVTLEASGELVTCTLTLGSNARVTLFTESAHINIWTAEANAGHTGAPIVSLPHASKVTESRRNFEVHTAYVSDWPCMNNDLGNATACGYGPGRDVMSSNFADFGKTAKLKLQARNLVTDAVQNAGLTQGSNTIHQLAPSVLGRAVSLSYGTAFENPSTAGQGSFRFEIVGPLGDAAVSNVLSVGGKAFTMSVAPADSADRLVELGEPTTFRFLLNNIGTERDNYDISFSTDDASWDIDVLTGSVPVEPGATGYALVRVTPPATALVGDDVNIQVIAGSDFPNEVADKSIDVSVGITDQPVVGAALSGGPSALKLAPGEETSLRGFSLENEGTAVGTFLIESEFIPAAPGWTVAPTPPSRTIDARGLEEFTMDVTVADNAASGSNHILRVKARLLGGDILDTVDIPVTIEFNPALNVFVRESQGTHVLRADSGATNPADDSNDLSAVYRVNIINPTGAPQNFEITNTWVGTNAQGCAAGSHNGWKISLDDGEGGFDDGLKQIAEVVTLAAKQNLERFVHLEHPGTGACAPFASTEVGLSFKSQEVSSFQLDKALKLVVPSNQDVIIAPTCEALDGGDWIGCGDSGDPIEQPAVRNGDRYSVVRYPVRLVNDGNQLDDVQIQIPTAPKSGWTQKLALRNGGSITSDGITPCALSSAERVLTCNGVGVGDTIGFDVVVQAPASEPLGTVMETSLIIRSLENNQRTDDGLFRTQTVGAFAFDAKALRSVTNVGSGELAALPFTIENIGTRDDQFTVSIIAGDSAWSPRFGGSISTSQEVQVPGRNDFVSYVLVENPGVSTGTKSFTVEVASKSTGQKALIALDARAVTGTTGLRGDPNNNFLLSNPGQANTVSVVLQGATNGASVTFRADVDALPDGWRLVAPTATGTVNGGIASGSFQVIPPSDALGTSQVALRVTANDGSKEYRTDLLLTVETVAGLRIDLISANTQFVSPGAATRWTMEIVNTGLDQDVVALSTSQLPPGWSVSFEATQVSIQPLERFRTSFDVNVPAGATPKTNVTFQLFASSQSDGGFVAQQAISAVVGFREIDLQGDLKRTGAPEETASIVIPVQNTGSLSERVAFDIQVATTGYEDLALASTLPQQLELSAGQTRDLVVNVQLGAGIPAGIDIVFDVTGRSLFSPTGESVISQDQVTLTILDYRAADIDGDLVIEYAVDRDQDASNGFEQFRESGVPGGRASVPADLQRFFNDAALATWTETTTTDGVSTTVFTFVVDGDDDDRVDHFLDDTGDGLPDVYWDPDDEHSSRLSIAKDIDADNVADYFVDVDGDGRLDRVFNIITGKWTGLIAIDNNDGTRDYVVDKNGNGRADADESVLVTRNGRVVAVQQQVDVDGDGKLDLVVDEDGDGKPDYFIRNGETTRRDIILKDVNGDGIEDWTYDGNLDGRPDGYYDPATKQGGNKISAADSFTALAKEFWYVPVLFVLVVVLFIVLVAVTRR